MLPNNRNSDARIPPNCFGLALVLMALLPVLSAQERLTLDTLAAWTATGKTPIVESGTGAITLPAGSQLLRTYVDGRVTVRLLSRPYFQAKPANWPALEVGPAALTFVQDGTGGGMVLLGDSVLALPQTIILGADGRSVSQIDLSLNYDHGSNQATLTIDGSLYHVGATAADPEVTVAVSAGSEATWTLDIMEVNSSPSTTEPDAKPGISTGSKSPPIDSPASAQDISKAKNQIMSKSSDLFQQGDLDGGEALLLSLNRQAVGSVEWQIESAVLLVRMAFHFNTTGEAFIASKIAKRAMAHLFLADRNFGQALKPGPAANIKELEAVIQERLLGDVDSARDGYAAAAKLAPGSGQAATRSAQLNRQQASADAAGHNR